MNSEILSWKGQKRDLELEVKRLSISIEGQRDALRMALNPHMPVAGINPELVQQTANELSDKVALYLDKLKDLESLNRALDIT